MWTMSCTCGCHNHKPPTTGWERFMPAIVGAASVAARVAGAMLKASRNALLPDAPLGDRTNSAARH